MIDVDLFQKALCLCPSWYVKGSEFSLDKKLLTIQIDFTKGAHFSCPECGQADCPVHDTQDNKWRHLNFFQYECYYSERELPVISPSPFPSPDQGRGDSLLPLLAEERIEVRRWNDSNLALSLVP